MTKSSHAKFLITLLCVITLLPVLLSLPSLAEPLQTNSASPGAITISKTALGNIVFNDPSLSNPVGQSCASCHNPAKAFSDSGVVASEGAVKGAFASRNAPTLTYASFIPALNLTGDALTEWRGGLFWNGRADTLEEQAHGPFFNPLEMNNTPAGLAKALRAAPYFKQLQAHYGEPLKSDEAIINAATDVLGAFQRSDVFSKFNSKFDYKTAGLLSFTESEARGEKIFNTIGMCTDCHKGSGQGAAGKELFSNYVYHTLLVPPNPSLPFYNQPKSVNPLGHSYIDYGLAENPKLTQAQLPLAKGRFRTPSLRNIELTPPYMHNGVFKTLEEVIEFYTAMPKFWPPETEENRSPVIAQSFDLFAEQKQDLLAFLKTLTDDYPAPAELKQKLKGISKNAFFPR